MRANLLLIALGTVIGVSTTALAQSPIQSGSVQSSFFAPARHQLDVDLLDMVDIVDPSSIVRRRLNSSPDTAIHLTHDLGTSTMQQVEFTPTFWFDSVNAAQFQFRYFFHYGSEFASAPLIFNGDVIAPGQNLSMAGTTWFTGGLFYERRITPWLDRAAAGGPSWLQGWDVRPKVGLEFVYLDFQINNAHPKLLGAGAAPLDVRGRWHDQELPVPTLGIELRRAVARNWAFEVTAQGTWINKWPSGRSQGGEVYLSQSTFETHLRMVYSNERLWGVRPFLGFSYYYYKQTETSGGIGNLIRLQTYGPEFGISSSY